MKYIQFTYIDAITKVSLEHSQVFSQLVFPDVKGLEFVWARESAYPTDVPHFFGTCDPDADTDVEGVMRVLSEEDFNLFRTDELRQRVPATITMRQARLALLRAGLLGAVNAAFDAIEDADDKAEAQIEWEYAATVERNATWVSNLSVALGLTVQQLDDLFIQASLM